MALMKRRAAFTLVELLIVISIIAVLISLLLPVLGSAAKPRSRQSAANIRNVAQGVLSWEIENGTIPPSYVYGASPQGDRWIREDQQEEHPEPSNGYIHWSWMLFNVGATGTEAFQCPTVLNGGAPPTNPGPNAENWEPGQINDLGDEAPRIPEDRQVKRVAYTGNGAIFPRNKFSESTAFPRRFQLVKSTDIESPSRTILATEFFEYPRWASLYGSRDGVSDNDGDNPGAGGLSSGKIKSHRPVMPFLGLSAGANVRAEPISVFGGDRVRFRYPFENEIKPAYEVGPGAIEDNNTQLNAVGRHHQGGQVNFVFVDGHVELTTVQKTVKDRLWGERLWSLSGGNNRILAEHEMIQTN